MATKVTPASIIDHHNVERRFPAIRIAEEGLFEAQLEGVSEALEYLVELTTWSGETFQISDPYSYGPILGELEKLGAHLMKIKGHAGVSFAVWAPNAQRVSVVGDFNGWDGRTHQMRKRIEAGIWEIFIPGVGESAHYKYEVRNCFGNIGLKSDPFSFFGQHGVQTASLVFNLDRFRARLKRCARALFPVTLSRWNAADRTTVISPMSNGAAGSRPQTWRASRQTHSA